MLRIDDENRRLVPLAETIMAQEHLLERNDVQDMFVRSWDAFVEELGFPNLRFLGQEVQPHESVSNRIDILGFDEDAAVPVIIELKRERHKLHLLQALGYAAMVWTWDDDALRGVAGDDADDNLLNSIDNRSEDESPRIILIAEDYDPEVILTADWLSTQHDVDISCFSIWMQKHGDHRLVRFQLDYPLRQLQEVYRARRRTRAPAPPSKQSWDDVKQWIDYDWGIWLIDLCRDTKDGQPDRRRFTALFPDHWGSYYLNFQKDGVKVTVLSRKDGDIEHWQQTLPFADVWTWGSENSSVQGLSFKLSSRDEAEQFLKAVGHHSPGR